MILRVAIALAVATVVAHADPLLGRVMTAPTAWLPAAGQVTGTASANEAGLDHGGDGDGIIGYGLGGIAEVDLGTDTDVRRCPAPCSGKASPIFLGRAAFRLGARQDAWFAGQPALVFGVRTTLAGQAQVGEAYVVASRAIGPLRLHLGGEIIAAGIGDAQIHRQVRPLGGIEWTPAQFPKTSIVADLMWDPLFVSKPTLEYLSSYGVRYQTFTWASVELGVRHREATELGDTTVMVRVNAVWSP